MAEKFIKNNELQGVIFCIMSTHPNGQPAAGLLFEKLKGTDPTATKRKLNKIRDQAIPPYQEYIKADGEIETEFAAQMQNYPEKATEDEKKIIDEANAIVLESKKVAKENLGNEIGLKLDILNPIQFEALQLQEDSKAFYNIDFLGKLICDDYTEIAL